MRILTVSALKTFAGVCIRRQCSINSTSSDLRAILFDQVKTEREQIKQFVATNGEKKIGEVKLSQIYGGMRDIPALLCETSKLDPNEGIRFRGLTIPECQQKLPKAKDGEQPLPEAMFWLLLTGLIPSDGQVKELSVELATKAKLPDFVTAMLKNLPNSIHPMAQLSMAISALSSNSRFGAAYNRGEQRQEYWKYYLDDAIDLIAKMPIIAAQIYRNVYCGGEKCAEFDANIDWSENFCRMLGYSNPKFFELMRLYLTIHSDHDAGNVSAHATHLVASALSDPYLSFAAGINGLAGPLHGLANQEVLVWIHKMQKELGNKNPPEDEVKLYIQKTLNWGRVIPGYGHAVLRKTDPRFTIQQRFAEKHMRDDETFKLVMKIYKVAPPILRSLAKVRNPWPNVDAHSGVLLQYYGMKEMKFYTVLFGVSRVLGVMASTVWHRALLIPIERPKCFTTKELMAEVTKEIPPTSEPVATPKSKVDDIKKKQDIRVKVKG